MKELTDLTYEQEKMLKRKNKDKSVLDDEDNADKVIQGMMGKNFHKFEDMHNPDNTDDTDEKKT